MPSKRAVLLAVPLLLLLASAGSLAQTPETLRADYDLLRQGRYRTAPVDVPSGGVRWSFGEGTWTLESGRLWLAEPTAGGAVTGLVFEGQGRFRMNVPDPFELAQLRRLARRPDLQGIDEPFSLLVLRASGELPLEGITVPPASGFAPQGHARERHEHWLTMRIEDVDARVLAALHTPGDRYLRADVRTAGFGWLTYDYDGLRIEEIRLTSFHPSYPYPEVWLSLDRAEDRDERGRPASGVAWVPTVDVEHVDAAVDLTKPGRDQGWTAGRFEVGLRFEPTPRSDGARALLFELSPFAKVTAVREEGRALPFVRDHVGGRTTSLDNRFHDDSLLVFLDKPLARGQERRLDFEYEMELLNYVPGRSWYPGVEGDEIILRDPHTARLELTVRKKHEIRAMGRREEGSGEEGEKGSTSVWVVEEPAKMLTFSFAEHFHEEKVGGEKGLPEVICFGPRVGVSSKNKFWNVGADVVNSINFFQQLFAAPLPERTLYVTGIEASHGQSFDGFIHMAEASFDVTSPGATELFRAHEVAHQWWGHLVGPATYRDTWLGEAFAEYSAMMFVEASMKDGRKLFQEMVRTSGEELNGSIKSGFSKFARRGVSLVNRAHGDRIGPIGHGWRASTGEALSGYSSQVYTKGALVLHMLRGLLRDMTKSDQAFIDVLRDFIRTHRGGYPSTGDFQAAVARRVPADWSWFFDQWVYGTAIPSYRWSYTVAGAPSEKGEWVAALTVRQSDVPAGFRMPVPVAVELSGGRTGRLRVMVRQPEETFQLRFPEKPKSLVFNPDDEVLAKMKRD